MEQATLAGGCYWCLEAYFKRTRGVSDVESGYSGGHLDNPSVQDVYDGGTGHAEVVQLTFDPSIITYREILEIFFTMHDPTTFNRQGNDVGEIYRSAVYYHSEDQRHTAEDVMQGFAADLYDDPIVTQLEPFTAFWPADEYMQDYYDRNPAAGYCQIVIDPKIQKMRKIFADRYIEA